MSEVSIVKKILVNGQWQGGADISTLYGAKEIEDLYLRNIKYDEADVSADENNLAIKNNIVAYEVLRTQMEQVYHNLKVYNPDKLFTIGGGCDADFPSIAYMNQKYNGGLKILYFDAHGDINSPEESESKLFYGMPLRCLIKDSDHPVFPIINNGIKPEQIIHIGGRELDKAEGQFMNEKGIKRITVEELTCGKTDFEKMVLPDEKVYIHLDLDVLEPQEFPHVPLPVPGGITVEALKNIMDTVKHKSSIVGMGIFEYKPCGRVNEILKYLIGYGVDF